MTEDEWFRACATAAIEAALDPDVPHDPTSVLHAMMDVAAPTIIAKDEDRAVIAILEAMRLELEWISNRYADATHAPADVHERVIRMMWLSALDDDAEGDAV